MKKHFKKILALVVLAGFGAALTQTALAGPPPPGGGGGGGGGGTPVSNPPTTP